VIDKLNSGDDKKLTFDFNIPSNATEKTYTFNLKTYFRYNTNNNGCSETTDTACYDKNSFDDLDKTLIATIKVEGNCQPVVTTPQTQITATLQSDAIAGQDLVVKATVTNAGASQTYTILTSGTESFSTLSSINPQTFTLAKGESKDVLITLNANDDASGDYTFSIKALSGSNVIKDQPVTLNVQAKSSSFTGLNSLFSNLSTNWLIWVIVLINVILIVLIIVIAIRIARK
jgi:VCBS repeat-containing protein